MYRIRSAEKIIADNYYNEVREMHTPIHLCDGEEAIAVGVCMNLSDEDMIFSNHRPHGHFLAKGGSLHELMAELHSKATGCCKGKGGSMHLCDIEHGIMLTSAIVAGNVSIATGYALAQKIKNDSGISVVFFGDGASEEGNTFESICYAVNKNLPVLFVCENNRVAVSTPFELREPRDSVKAKYNSIIETFSVDGNDVEEVESVTRELIDKIRKGDGPYLVECDTYRLRAHSNIGDGVDGFYRKKEELENAKQKDPIVIYRKRLIDEGVSNIDELSVLENRIDDEVIEAYERARKDKLVEIKELYTDICE